MICATLSTVPNLFSNGVRLFTSSTIAGGNFSIIAVSIAPGLTIFMMVPTAPSRPPSIALDPPGQLWTSSTASAQPLPSVRQRANIDDSALGTEMWEYDSDHEECAADMEVVDRGKILRGDFPEGLEGLAAGIVDKTSIPALLTFVALGACLAKATSVSLTMISGDSTRRRSALAPLAAELFFSCSILVMISFVAASLLGDVIVMATCDVAEICTLYWKLTSDKTILKSAGLPLRHAERAPEQCQLRCHWSPS